LNQIKGIGEKTAKKLLLDFKSVRNIKDSDKELIIKLIGASKGEIVYNYFHQNN
jgi:excinuclease ABC subunit C